MTCRLCMRENDPHWEPSRPIDRHAPVRTEANNRPVLYKSEAAVEWDTIAQKVDNWVHRTCFLRHLAENGCAPSGDPAGRPVLSTALTHMTCLDAISDKNLQLILEEADIKKAAFDRLFLNLPSDDFQALYREFEMPLSDFFKRIQVARGNR